MAHEPTERTEAELPHPALKAILLCERTIQDAQTSNLSVIGVLDRVPGSEFPLDYVRGLELYVRVIDAAGEYPVRVEVVRLDDEQLVSESDTVFAIPDRTRSYDMRFDIPTIIFERPGPYEFRVFANRRFVAAAVLWVQDID